MRRLAIPERIDLILSETPFLTPDNLDNDQLGELTALRRELIHALANKTHVMPELKALTKFYARLLTAPGGSTTHSLEDADKLATDDFRKIAVESAEFNNRHRLELRL